MATTTLEELHSRFSAALGAALLPADHATDPVIERLAGHAQAPATDDQVRSEAVRTAHLIAQIEANIDQIKEREGDLKKKRAEAEALREMLRGDIAGMMMRAGVKRAQDCEITVALRKLPDTLKVNASVEELEFDHPEFVRVKREIDKAEINKHFKATGEVIDGVELIEGGHTVAISVA